MVLIAQRRFSSQEHVSSFLLITVDLSTIKYCLQPSNTAKVVYSSLMFGYEKSLETNIGKSNNIKKVSSRINYFMARPCN